MKFGTKASEEQVFSGDSYIRTFRKGETTVRFLQECDDWIMFREHFYDGKSFPCTNDRNSCPGCTHADERVNRASRKYAANVLIMPQSTHMVVKMPVTLMNRMQARSDRNEGMITNRDYVVIRSGEGLDTEYDVESGDKYAIDVSKHQLFDIENMLSEAFKDVWGDGDEPRKKSRFEDKNETDIPPSKPSVQSASEDEEGVEVTEDDLLKMPLMGLLALARDLDIDVGEDTTKEEIVEHLLQKASA